jgi:hypothetical protein
MRCVVRVAIPIILPIACLAAGPARAAEPDRGTVVTAAATLRSVDTARGVIAVETSGGERGEFRVDAGETLIFKGIRTLALDELAPGMRLDMDYRPGTGGAMPLATWIEVAGPGLKDKEEDLKSARKNSAGTR